MLLTHQITYEGAEPTHHIHSDEFVQEAVQAWDEWHELTENWNKVDMIAYAKVCAASCDCDEATVVRHAENVYWNAVHNANCVA